MTSVDQTTAPGTTGDYWVRVAGSGVWRVARKNMLCKGGTRRTEHYISAGERYLDTGEKSAVWATYKCCRTCADVPSDLASQSAKAAERG